MIDFSLCDIESDVLEENQNPKQSKRIKTKWCRFNWDQNFTIDELKEIQFLYRNSNKKLK
jgi:hypothetical protein